MPKTRVLLTGAAGGVAQMVLPGLVESYDLVLTDRVSMPGVVQGELADADFLAKITDGVDAIVHLAANANPGATWEELRVPNVDVVAGVLATGVPRVVLASSAHVMGQYVVKGLVPVDPDLPPAPCCAYGATKAFAESLGRAHAYRTDTSVVALRLGATTPEPPASSALGAWLGPADLRQLVRCGLEADVRYAMCPGISANTRTQWEIRNEIGFRPVLDSEPYASQVPVDETWGPCGPASVE